MKPEIPNIYNYGTQLWKVVDMLKTAGGQGLTGRDFYKVFIPEYRTRINRLRKDGYIIPEPKHEPDSRFVRFILIGYAPLFKEAV